MEELIKMSRERNDGIKKLFVRKIENVKRLVVKERDRSRLEEAKMMEIQNKKDTKGRDIYSTVQERKTALNIVLYENAEWLSITKEIESLEQDNKGIDVELEWTRNELRILELQILGVVNGRTQVAGEAR